MQYCRVIDNIPEQPRNLPNVWGNISNFFSLTNAELAAQGWYPFVPSAQPSFNPATQRVERSLRFAINVVNEVWTVVALTDAEKMDYLRQQRAILKSFLDRYMDSQVAPKDYDSVLTACTWINASTPEWANDARAASAFREECFKRAYQIEADVLAGLRPVPTEAEFQAEMPVLWAPTPLPDNGNGTISGNGTLS